MNSKQKNLSLAALLTIAVLSAILLKATFYQSIARESCNGMTIHQLEGIESKNSLENFLHNYVVEKIKKREEIVWGDLAQCINASASSATVEYIQGGGIENSDVYRFVVDNSSIFNRLIGAPGASNGVYLAVFNVTQDGRIAIIDRGGVSKWLKSE